MNGPQPPTDVDDSYWFWHHAPPDASEYNSGLRSLEREPIWRAPHLEPGELACSRSHGFRYRTDDGRWLVGGRLEERGMEWEICELRVIAWPWGDSRAAPVTPAALRSFSFRRVLRDVQRRLAEQAEEAQVVLDRLASSEPGPETFAERLQAMRQRQEGSSGVSVDAYTATPPPKSLDYERTAREYLRLKDEKYAGPVNEELARRLGNPDSPLPVDTVRTWLRRAEEEGYLTKGRPGVRFGREAGANLWTPEVGPGQ